MTGEDRQRDPLGLSSEPAAPKHALDLALRYGMRYSSLREIELDPRLLIYVPLDVCEREKVVPVTVAGDVLEIATAFPEPDLELIQQRFPALAIELVFAPARRIDELHAELREAVR
ncbi:MAG: hypothetical protein Q8O56_00835 [Solirubrobacteraceae bacterium]|nr:hypothetical protein [Solirubrobacteraceae bacterium]